MSYLLNVDKTAADARVKDERRPDLIEHALVAAVIALVATVGTSWIATGIITAFTNIASHLAALTPAP
jgi:Flp pilus assembly pilin Flp